MFQSMTTGRALHTLVFRGRPCSSAVGPATVATRPASALDDRADAAIRCCAIIVPNLTDTGACESCAWTVLLLANLILLVARHSIFPRASPCRFRWASCWTGRSDIAMAVLKSSHPTPAGPRTVAHDYATPWGSER